MRTLAFLAAAAVALAGCLQAPTVVDTPRDDGRSMPTERADPTALAEEPTFCASEDGCDFWDDDYHEFVLYEVDTATLDVLIVPSASADHAEDTPVLKAAVEAWAAGIQALGEDWFAEGVTFRVYVLGEDTPPMEALADPEIVVLAAEYNPVLLFGIGEQLPASPCRGDAVKTYAPHRHDGMSILAADCAEGGFTCVAINTNFLTGDSVQLHDLVAHEFGHCLGGGHVGDALDFTAKHVPVQDIMSYQHDEAQVHCVSNLNVRVLEALYAPILGATVAQPVAPGDFYTMARTDYEHVVCANPG